MILGVVPTVTSHSGAGSPDPVPWNPASPVILPHLRQSLTPTSASVPCISAAVPAVHYGRHGAERMCRTSSCTPALGCGRLIGVWWTASCETFCVQGRMQPRQCLQARPRHTRQRRQILECRAEVRAPGTAKLPYDLLPSDNRRG